MKKNAVIIANGEKPSVRVLKFFLHHNSPYKVAADGGLRHFLAHKYMPDLIIGDLDSVPENILASIQNKVSVQQITRQNDTDLEKAILHLLDSGYTEISILGANGGRMDHSLANIGLLVKYHPQLKAHIITNTSVVEVVTNKVTINTRTDDVISLYGVNGDVCVRSNGLLYELEGQYLRFGGFESTSNKATGRSVELMIQDGMIIMVRELKDYIRSLKGYATDTN